MNVSGVLGIFFFLHSVLTGRVVSAATLTRIEKDSKALGFFQFFVPESFIEENVFFYLYSRTHLLEPEKLLINNLDALRHSNFDSSKKTVMLVHGFETSFRGEWIQEAKDSLLQYHDVNVIALDFGNINSDSYLTYWKVVIYSPKIGSFLGRFICFLSENGVSPEDIYLVGHSLGAHVAAFAGKTAKKDGKTIGRLTALDPCYAGYGNNAPEYRLGPHDAVFTDCIFTTFGSLSSNTLLCQANYFPNGVGISQPGCYREDIGGGCSHSRVTFLFIESINSPKAFGVMQCFQIPSAESSANCWPTDNSMGYFARSQSEGIYYLKTNARYPYSVS